MLSDAASRLMEMFRVIEAAKDAVERFEDGEVNAREAVRLIVESASQNRAA